MIDSKNYEYIAEAGGWIQSGDARIAHNLSSSIQPTDGNYMAMISTGIGSGESSYYSSSEGSSISQAFAVTLPVFLNFFIAAGLFPNMQAERLEWMVAGATLDRNLLSGVFAYNAGLYCLIYIFIDALFGGLIALVSLAITRLSGSFFTVIVVPFVLFIFQGIVMVGDSWGNWTVMGMINPQQMVNTRWYQMIFVYVLILIVSIGTSILVNRKRDIL